LKIGHPLDTALTRRVEFSTHGGIARSPERRRPEVMLFDLDGTLVDTMGAFADLAAEVMVERYGLLRRNARHLYLQTSGVPFAQQLEIIFGELAENRDAAAEFEARKAAVAGAAEMDGETRGAMESLRDAGVRLVVSSNGNQEHVEGFAARSGGLFELALGFGAGLAKGEPHVALVCDALGARRERMAFVGDSLRDGELAAQTGLSFIARAGTFSRRDLARRFPDAPVVDSLGELPALI
jgi:HAD superfamily hydrolase (TIGR01549 family)